MWVLTNSGETAVNLERADRLTVDYKKGMWRIIAWTPGHGTYVFESTDKVDCTDWINAMIAKMNGRLL